MAMRTMECNLCGEPLTAESDEALVVRLGKHVAGTHPEADFDEAQAREEVAADAYTASDN